MDIITLESILPIFVGFYNTEFDVTESWEDSELHYLVEDVGLAESEAQNKMQSVEWGNVFEEMAGELSDALISELNVEYPKLKLEMKGFELRRPKEYNFTNDSILVTVSMDVEYLRKVVTDNRNALRELLLEEFTQRPGFIPFYSNNVDEWMLDIRNYDCNEVWVLLTVLCRLRDITSETLLSVCNLEEIISNAVTYEE